MRHLHVLTPGDHFSPRTGSAIATVVDGLARNSPGDTSVLVAHGTYPERYPSASVVEYRMNHSPHGAPRSRKLLDHGLGRLGLPRPWARMIYRQTLVDQKKWEPSYVIAHNGIPLIPLVADPHKPVLYAHNNLLNWYGGREARRALERAHRIVCVSQYTAQQFISKAPMLQDRVRVVNNGVDLDLFPFTARPVTQGLRVGFVGRVIPSKGVHVLLEALARLNRADVEVTIVGSSGFSSEDALSPYEMSLRELANEVPGTTAFQPFQQRPELPRIFASFDVVVVASTEPEAFPLTILEAMASGAAVVASDIGGVAEAAGGAAILVPPNDAESMAQALANLAASRDLVRAYAVKGRKRAERATWSHSASFLATALAD